MSDQDAHTPPYTGPGNTPRGRARLPASRRRDKPQLSCNLCRRRKLKCNREQPCSSCTQRGLGMSCTYSGNAELSSRMEKDQAPKKPGSLQDRIQHLEDLVVELMHKTSAAITPISESHTTTASTPSRPMVPRNLQSTSIESEDTPDTESIVSDIGTIDSSDTGEYYVNSSHWAAILDGISEIKEYFDKEKTEQHAQLISDNIDADMPGPQLLFGCSRNPDIGDILASVPPRPIVDRLVSQYFNSFEMSPAILHSVQFLKEYNQFWEEPAATPCIWLGLLFAIMCLAAQLQKFSSSPSTVPMARASMGLDLDTMITTFRQGTAQCLVLGRYTKGGPYVLETLMLYFTSEYFLCRDAEIGVWIVLSIIFQVAIHTGYHKDPKHFKDMSPFTSEMRRRVWATIVDLDLGISAQMGVPRLIKPAHVDTEEPRNLLDSDFNQTTELIPPARPESELTPMLYRIAKSRLISSFGLIWDAVVNVKSPSYAEVTELDAELEKAHKSTPSCLEWQSITLCVTDTPQIIMQKLFLKSIYWRAKIVLHRKFLSQGYPYSREACLNAAFRLLDSQHMLDKETRPFGQLYQDRWKVSSLVNHDFLLAASLLCSYLQQVYGPGHQIEDSPEVDKITNYLTRSREIWIRSSTTSKEAQKAVKALNIILRNRTVHTLTPSPEDSVSYGLQSLAGYTDPYSYDNDMDVHIYRSTWIFNDLCASPGYVSGIGTSPPFIDLSITDNLAFLFEEPPATL
ncbi:fungal-specific transcription factor domain-containing protein [Nemania abortiva]|nr:fungal-specific transcription factor domain-containing protein [Nemania abortiva]